ncbi:calmodulin-binding protein 60 A-like [Salvia miltiorrhiza]|uniref:calmodulin-binding protein 60 A-like n=1 Tax=Salvia miltiorrhiza TaxID=226208 RepID=UPI0025AD646B|nr:calmodulin-binding protein 60 A-like [Salvia miltiorrhiza]
MFGLLVPPTSKFASDSLIQAPVIIIFADIHSYIVTHSAQFSSILKLRMSHKRHGREEGGSIDEKRLRKSHSFRSVVLEVINLIRMQNLMNPLLEPLIRRVVKEEVDSALRKYIVSVKRNSGKDSCSSDSKSLQLQLQLKFLNAISLPVFTGTRIEGDGGTSVEVALVDVHTGEVVSNGAWSSAKVEIVVLEGDFDGDEGDNWSVEEFANNVVREREGKKPLLTGDVILTLNNGTGSVGDISFTDNSSWTRSRKFRLGARLLDDVGGLRIREARSDPFVVRDHRGELYKKHHPPSLTDEVWRLEKIGKDGAFHKRLSKEGIRTVHDFLLLLSLDPTRLRNILGNGMSAKKWEVTMEHARTCVLDKKLYLYNTTSPGQNGVVFNVVGQVVGIFSDGQYVASDKLSDEEKADAHQLVTSAFRYHEKIVIIDESSLNMPSSSPGVSNAEPSSSLLSEGSYQQDSTTSQSMSRSTYSQLVASSPDFMQSFYPFGASNSFDYYLPGIDPMEIRYDQSLGFPSQVADTSICDTDAMARYFEPDCSLRSPNAAVSAERTHKGWKFLACVLRWRFSVKRIVSRKSRC